jgi:hypothetical protein
VGLSRLIRVEEFTTSRREHPATARMITAAEIGHSTAGEQLGARNRAGQQLSALLFARGRLRPAGPSEALPAAADVVDGLPGRACDLLNRAGLLERPEPRFYLP